MARQPAVEIKQDKRDENDTARFVRQYNTNQNIIDDMAISRNEVQAELERIDRLYGTDESGVERIDNEKYNARNRQTTRKNVTTAAVAGLTAAYAVSSKSVLNEYNQSYQSSKFATNTSIEAITKGRVPGKRAFEKAFNNVWNPLADDRKLNARKAQFANRVYGTIIDGAENGLSIREISKNLDIVYGFRNSQGVLLIDPRNPGKTINATYDKKTQKITFSKKPRKLQSTGGEIYSTIRIARTEMARLQKVGSRQDMLDSQKEGIDSRQQKISVLDDRTRPQSAQMDQQISDDEGKFKFPGIANRIFPEDAPIQYLANDRGTYVPFIESISSDLEQRIARNQETGKSEIIGNMTFFDWAETQNWKTNAQGVIVNRYNQVLERG